MLAQPGKYIPALLLALLSQSALPAGPSDVLDSIYDLGRQWIELRQNKPEKIPSTEKFILPNDIPTHWHAEFIEEPIFNTKVLLIESGRRHNHSILLVHGLGQSGFRDWLNVIPALEGDYHIITLDLPGFGHSGKPSARYSPENYAKLLDWLLTQRAKNTISLVGHSMGAAVTLKLAASKPQRFKNVVLADAAGILQRDAFLKHSLDAWMKLDNIPLQATENIETRFINRTLQKLINKTPDPTQYLLKHDLLWKISTYDRPNMNAAYALIETDFSQDIKRNTSPTTIIWGRKDSVAPLRTGKMLAQKLPLAQLVVIEDAEHVPMNTHKSLFNKLLRQAIKIEKPNVLETKTAKPGENDLICKKTYGRSYYGEHKNISITNCTDIELTGINAAQLTVKNSIVYLNDVQILSDGTACDFYKSIIIATNLNCSGNTAIVSDGSQLDLAGSNIAGKNRAIYIKQKSTVVLSVSDLTSDNYSGQVHGSYTAKSILLDKVIASKINSDR